MQSGIFTRFFIGSCFVFVSSIHASGPAGETRNIVKEWVAVEKTISAEAAQWSEKQRLLNDLINLAQVEIETLESSITEIESTRSAADATRKQLLAEQDVLAANHTNIRTFLETMEPNLKAIQIQLPYPLIKKLAPFYERLPENPKETTLGLAKRVQSVIAILITIQKFDREITVSDELRAFEDGAQGEVRVVYVGLSAAYYYTPYGDEAGIGYPGNTGWIWESKPSLHSKIEEVIAIADQSTSDARFITLPVSLQNQADESR